MAPRIPKDESSSEAESLSSSESERSDSVSRSEEQNLAHPKELPDVEKEFHTEDSDSSVDSSEGESEFSTFGGPSRAQYVAGANPPFLPPELLKPLLSPVVSTEPTAQIPWDQLTRTQKKTRRNHERAAKKKVWDELRRNARGTGVLEAGRAAQAKRMLVGTGGADRVRGGRIEKKSKPVASGRQQLLESRKRERQRSDSTAIRSGKKQRKG